jgi:hypothetical protein
MTRALAHAGAFDSPPQDVKVLTPKHTMNMNWKIWICVRKGFQGVEMPTPEAP